jgi:predicted transcriptional regulator
MTLVTIRALLGAYIAEHHRTQAEAARVWGVSSAFVSMVMQGDKLPTAVMLDAIGIERVVTVTYRFKEAT